MGDIAVEKERDLGLDVIRMLAIVCVIGGHFFSLNTGFKKWDFGGIDMFLAGMVDTFAMIGVPLFMILTGYLNINKVQLSRRYYRGIWRVLIAYLFFSIVTILFRVSYLGEHRSLVKWVNAITSFEAISYAWYIEMWIGLFLLTPFLNKLWHSITEKRDRLILIGTLFLCSAIPDFTNRYGLHLMPGYWGAAAYPLLCFYLGCYFRTYTVNIRRGRLGLIVVGLCLFNPLICMVIGRGRPLLHLAGGPAGIISIPIAVCIFLIFSKMGGGKTHRWNFEEDRSIVDNENFCFVA